MKTAIIIIHCIGIVAGIVVAAVSNSTVKTVAGIVSASANGLGVYLSSVVGKDGSTKTEP